MEIKGKNSASGGIRQKSRDCSSQTDTHFIESHIQRDYEWNEWELRRNAIRLANMCQKATHSSQTESSFWRTDSSSQADQKRDCETQTSKDESTSTTDSPLHLSLVAKDHV